MSKPTTHYRDTFNKDATLPVQPKNVERMLKSLHNLAGTMKYGLVKAPFKITASDEPNEDGFIIIRIRAYSTKNWEQAGERLAEFLNRDIYAFATHIKCASDPVYFTVGSFVIMGEQSPHCETTYRNTRGNYVVKMDENDANFSLSLCVPVKNAIPKADAKFSDFCKHLQEALDELKEETSFEAIINQLDPEVIVIEERLAREHQEHEAAKNRAAELAKRRAKIQERAAEEQHKIDKLTLNRFASLTVDEVPEDDTTPSSSSNKKPTSWATKASQFLPPPPAAPQREKPQAKPHKAHEVKPQTNAQAAPTSPHRPKGKCHFSENCRRFDCPFEHPASRDASKLVPKAQYEKMRAEKQQHYSRQRDIDCRNGENCTYPNCKFNHPDDHTQEESIPPAVEEESIPVAVEEKQQPEYYFEDFPPLGSVPTAWC